MKLYLSHRQPHEYCKPAGRHHYNGQWLTALELSEMTGIPRPTIYARLRRGQPFEVTGKGGPVPQLYEFRGQMMTVPQVAGLTGLDKSTLYDRISGNRIMELHEIGSAYQTLEDWGDRIKVITYGGKSNSVAGWARETGISRFTIYARLSMGWTVAEALTRPVDTRRRPKVITRNHRFISLITRRFRRARTQQLIHRIVTAFKADTGGYDPISPYSQGTGVGRHAHDLQREKMENAA